MNYRLPVIIMLIALCGKVFPQSFPDLNQNIPFLMLYGKDAPASLGDPDHIMDVFCLVPENRDRKVYVRIYDPQVGSDLDEITDKETVFRYTVLGGKGCFSMNDHYKGTILAEKTFGYREDIYYTHETIGGFEVSQGEYDPVNKGYIFKVVIEAMKGSSGNQFTVEMSERDDYNSPVEGVTIFFYDITFRLYNDPEVVWHYYPVMTDKTKKIFLETYDMDNEGMIRVLSANRRDEISVISGDNTWLKHSFDILPGEKGNPLDIQIEKCADEQNRYVVVTIRLADQSGKPLMPEPWSISRWDPVEESATR
jgi:hypothetical protein